MKKVSKDILERAIKAGMKSEGYSGRTLDRRAVEALRGAKMGKLLNKDKVDQKQVYAALEALKKKGLISEKVDEKMLIKKSAAEERKQEQKEKFEERLSEADKQRIQQRTAKGYLRERQKEEGQDYSDIRKSISREGEGDSAMSSPHGEKRVHLGGQKPEIKSTGWTPPEEKLADIKPEPQEEPKDLPI